MQVLTLLLFCHDTLFAAVAKSSKPVSGKYLYVLWRKIGSGSWSSVAFTDTTVTCFLRSMTRDVSTGRFFISKNADIYYADDPAGAWTQATSTGGMMTVKADHGVVVAGGWKGIYTSSDNGSSWTQRDDLGLGSSCYGETTNYHTENWNGVHDIFWNNENAIYDWWATVYMDPEASGSCMSGADYGVMRSVDPPNTWTVYKSQPSCRGIAVDSCGQRIHYSSGAGFSGGTNNDTRIGNQRGKQTARWGGGVGSYLAVTEDVFTGTIGSGPTAADADYPNPTGGDILAYSPQGGSGCKVYVAVQGHGIMSEDIECSSTCGGGGGGCGDPPCETERGGRNGAIRSREESSAAPPPTMFSIGDARELVRTGKLELYDVSGRKARIPGSGVYFVIERNKAGAIKGRRMVVITP